ncbi:MAG: hypothetical protein KC493_01040 [Bacteriovoracaceae bacterium]|nr:hypothetical protein [Bacteriovoracaceae bacterium]
MALLFTMGKQRKIQGYVKTKHFVERQKERLVSDKQVELIIENGESVENDEGYIVYTFNQYTLVTDPWSESLITVHAEGNHIKSPKVLSLSAAREIKNDLQKSAEAGVLVGETFSNEFYQEMHKERVKVLSEIEDEESESAEVIDINEYLKKKSA